MSHPKISIIVPAYNVQSYVQKCLNSLAEQTYKNLEIIVIDDGSTDKTKDVIFACSQQDSRIRFLEQKHSGVSAARNKGLKIAQGDYIGFIDADDWVEENYFEKLLAKIEKDDCDIACAPIIRKRKFTQKYRLKYSEEKVYSTLEEKIKACDVPRCCYIWNKLYKADLVKNEFFKEGVVFEDILWLPEILKKSEKLAVITNTLYYYRVNKNSIVKKSPSLKVKMDNFNAKRYIVEFFSENNLELSEKQRNFEKKIIKIGKIKISYRKYKLSKKQIQELNSKYEKHDSSERLPKIKNKFKTLKTLSETEKSICRYGDGEFNLIFGNSIKFQEYSPKIAKRLKEILLSDNPDIMVGIPDVFGNLDYYTEGAKDFWRKYLAYNRISIYSHLNFEKQYYDSSVSRPYLGTKNKEHCEDYFKNIKKIWNRKKIVVVEGAFSRSGYNNDLFDNCSEVKRILCPSKNAFASYDKILKICIKQEKDALFILALGPTATILAYDLANLGYRALDLGHVDIEYEWFLQKATSKVPIKNKSVNECGQKQILTAIDDENYLNEVIGEV